MLNFGLSADEFRGFFLGKLPYFSRASHSTDIFGWRELNDLLHTIPHQPPSIRFHKDGELPIEEYTEVIFEAGVQSRRLSNAKVYKHLHGGGSIVFNRMDSHSLILRNICLSASRFLGCPTIANGYLAFDGASPFGSHWDTHDVLVIQLIGRKKWELFEPTVLQPLRYQSSKTRKEECPKTPYMSETLNAGDMLYVPRGWWHNVTPFSGEPTFHASIGLYPPLVIDYIQWVCATVLPNYLPPRQMLMEGADVKDLRNASAILNQVLTSSEVLERFFHASKEHERMSVPFSLEHTRLLPHPHDLRGCRLAISSVQGNVDDQEIMVNGGRPADELQKQIIALLITRTDAAYEGLRDEIRTHSGHQVDAAVRDLLERGMLRVCG